MRTHLQELMVNAVCVANIVKHLARLESISGRMAVGRCPMPFAAGASGLCIFTHYAIP